MRTLRRFALAAEAAREHATGTRAAAPEPMDAHEILARLLELPICTWSYLHEPSRITRLGPMAQQFHASFGFGASDTTIPLESALGVCMASIQVLARRVEQLEGDLASARESGTPIGA